MPQKKLIGTEFINVYDPNEAEGRAGMHSSGRSSRELADRLAMADRDAVIVREIYETRHET